MHWSNSGGGGIASREPKDENEGYHRLSRLDSRIRNQFDLISSRTGWLLTSHAFLVAAMATTMNGMNGDSPALLLPLRVAILVLLPIVGITTSVLVQKSITAAYRIIDDVKKARDVLLRWLHNTSGYECTTVDAFPVECFNWGDRPPKVFPLLLLGVWVILLVLAVIATSIEIARMLPH